MASPEGVGFQPLPGSDVLKAARLFEPVASLDYDEMRRFFTQGAHRTHLENEAYHEYLSIPKTMVDETGVHQLINIAEALEDQELPNYLDAAGSAFAEIGLAGVSMSSVERIEFINRAEQVWVRGLVNTVSIAERYGADFQYGENEGHRIALNLAFVPLMKSIVIGNVLPESMQKTMMDVAEIARDSRLSLDAATSRGDVTATSFHRGFLFEASALMALLYMQDPRYVPLPATARGDTGYYHPRQTHDISVVNQHWGDIRKVIPVEIKSSPSRRANRRYAALVVPGRVRLSVSEAGSCDTADAFYNLVHTQASFEETVAIEQLSTQLREMLRLYQQGITSEAIAQHGLTRFHDSSKVAQVYPELSKNISRRYRLGSQESA